MRNEEDFKLFFSKFAKTIVIYRYRGTIKLSQEGNEQEPHNIGSCKISPRCQHDNQSHRRRVHTLYCMQHLWRTWAHKGTSKEQSLETKFSSFKICHKEQASPFTKCFHILGGLTLLQNRSWQE